MSSLREELAALNKAVDEAIAKRTAWMDENMPAFARYKVGEVIFDRETGLRLGIVTRLYRYHGPDRDGNVKDARFDRSMSVEYEFETSANCFDNTSRHAGALLICNREELARIRDTEAATLRQGAK